MQAAISLRQITKRYGEIVAVDNMSFDVEAGTVFGLLGPNGAGKTTLLKILTTIAKPTSGHAFVCGHDVLKEGRTIRSIIGVVPQENNLDRMLTARENLVLHAKMHGLRRKDYIERVEELLEETGLAKRKNNFPDKFSNGMQRRLVVARGLIHDPRVLFLDEPTTGLDPQSRHAVWDYIESMRGKKTIFLTTHYMDEADTLCDRIIIMDHGRALVDGTSQQLKGSLREANVYEVAVNGDPNPYIHRLNSLDYIDWWKAKNSIFEICLKHERHFPELLDFFKPENIWRIGRKEPTLEDVFLKLTGRRLRD